MASLADILQSLMQSQPQGYGAKGLMQPVGDVIPFRRQSIEPGMGLTEGARSYPGGANPEGPRVENMAEMIARETGVPLTDEQKYRIALAKQRGEVPMGQGMTLRRIPADYPPVQNAKSKVNKADMEYMEQLAKQRGITPKKLFSEYQAAWPQAWAKYENPWE